MAPFLFLFSFYSWKESMWYVIIFFLFLIDGMNFIDGLGEVQ